MVHMKRRGLAFILALAMIVSMIPLTASATGENSKIQIDGGDAPVYSGGGIQSTLGGSWLQNVAGDSPRVQIAKTIAGTNVENEFDITLQVRTNQKVTAVAAMPDAATVLVIDNSGSMKYCMEHGKTQEMTKGKEICDTCFTDVKVEEHELDHSCKGCDSLINQSHESTCSDRFWVTDSQKDKKGKCTDCESTWRHTNTCSQMKNVNEDQLVNSCKNCKEALGKKHKTTCPSYKAINEPKTRLYAAKQAAIEFAGAFAESGAYEDQGESKSAPRWLSVVTFSNDATLKQNWVNISALKWVKDVETGSYMASDNDFTKTIWGINAAGSTNVAAGIKIADEQLAKLFGGTAKIDIEHLTRASSYLLLLGDGEPNEKVAAPQGNYAQYSTKWDTNYVNAEKWIRKVNTDGTKVMSAYAGVRINQKDPEGYKWFQSFDGNSKLASSVKELVAAFNTSITLLRLNTKAWLVEDTLETGMSYQSGGGANVATDEGVVTWTLRMDTPDIYVDDKKQNGDVNLDTLKGYELRYQTTYRVKLDSTQITKDTYQSVSDNTTLKYYLTNEEGKFVGNDGKVIPLEDDLTEEELLNSGVLLSMTFKEPKVKALYGDLTIAKTAYENPLAGATFEATLTEAADGTKSFTGTSNVEGNAQISDLPSGQSYTVTESAAPDGYDADKEERSVEIKWGDVYVDNQKIDSKKAALTVDNKRTQINDTELTVTKQWIDGGNPGSTRTDIVVAVDQYFGDVLMGEYTTHTLTARDANSDKGYEWTHTFTGLPTNNVNDPANGSYTYKVREITAVPGYEVTYKEDANLIINTATEKTSVQGTKIWIDDGNTAHSTVTIGLFADGATEPVATQTLANGETNYKFENLSKYNATGEISYTVQEIDVPTGYSAEINGTDITNRINQSYSDSLEATIIWVDDSNAQETRPVEGTGVTLTLKADGETIATADAVWYDDNSTSWQHTFTPGESSDGFPVYKVDADGKVTGEKIVYTVEQAAISALENGDYYDSTASGMTVTNTLKGKTEISGSKTWIVPENFEGFPEVTFALSGTDKKAQLTEGNTFAFTDLDKYDASGKLITYGAVEIVAGEQKDNFTKVIAPNEDGTYTATNTYQETMTVSGTKTWIDGNNAYETRPGSITVNLLADGVELKDVTVTADDDWSFSFSDLEKYRYETVVVSEAQDAVYEEVTNEGVDEEGNATSSTESVLVSEAKEAVTEEVAIPIVYTVTEDAITGTDKDGDTFAYVTTYDEHYNITNTLTGTTAVSFEKIWNDFNNAYDTRPVDGAVVTLLRDGAPTEMQVTVKEDGSFTFSNLDKFNQDGGSYQYTVEEAVPHGYTATQNGNVITNNLNQQTTAMNVNKVWVDANNADGTRPESIAVTLLQDGVAYGELAQITADENGGWKHSFTQLPVFKMDEAGKMIGKYEYTLEESPVDGYVTTINGGTITNRLENLDTASLSLTFNKYWNAPADYDLPEATFTIYQNGSAYQTVSSTEMTKHEDGFYTYTATDLPQYSDDIKYSYTVEETVVPEGFTSERSEGTNNFINTIDPGAVTLKGQKTWVTRQVRPDYSIGIQMFRDGSLLDTVTVASKEEDAFAFEISETSEGKTLPQYAADGHEYVYTINETPVDGYTTTREENHFTNSYQSFPYKMVAHYTATLDGEVIVSDEQKTIADNILYFYDQREVPLNAGHHVKFNVNGEEKTFSYQNAILTLAGESSAFTGDSLHLETPDEIYELHLYYTYSEATPKTHSITVNYYNYATRNNPQPTSISVSYQENKELGETYDLSDKNAVSVRGYRYVETTGDAMAGAVDGDKTINVWYRRNSSGGGDDGGTTINPTPPPVVEIPEEDVPLAELPNGRLPGAGITTEQDLAELPDEDVPLAELPDEDVPLAEIPDEDVPLAEIPDEEVPLAELPDEEVPLGDAPKTGDESKMTLWLSLLTLSGLGLGALFAFGKTKKEEEN